MKILFVNSAWAQSWGGGEKWTVDAALWFRERGHETWVIGRPDSRVVQAARAALLPTFETPFGGDANPRAIFRAYQLLREISPDAVITNFNKESWHFGWAGKFLKIPIVARHGFPLQRHSIHHRFLFRFLLRKLVVNATPIRDYYSSLGYDVSPVEVILNGVQIPSQSNSPLRARFHLAPEELLLVGAGRLELQKRFDLLIESVKKIIPRFPFLRVLVFGEGPLQSELQDLIDQSQLTQRVCLCGFLPDFANQISDADLFVLTSEKEGTPNVLLEAMAANVACVAFDVGAIPDLFHGPLKDNLVPFGQTDILAARISQLLENEKLRETTATEMHERIVSSFSLDASLTRYETILSEVISFL